MIGIALIIAALAGFAFVGITYVGFDALVLGPLAAALLIGVLALEKAGAVRRLRPAAYLGDSSYSIYLWHTMADLGRGQGRSDVLDTGRSHAGRRGRGGVVVGAACHESWKSRWRRCCASGNSGMQRMPAIAAHSRRSSTSDAARQRSDRRGPV